MSELTWPQTHLSVPIPSLFPWCRDQFSWKTWWKQKLLLLRIPAVLNSKHIICWICNPLKMLNSTSCTLHSNIIAKLMATHHPLIFLVLNTHFNFFVCLNAVIEVLPKTLVSETQSSYHKWIKESKEQLTGISQSCGKSCGYIPSLFL